MRKGTWNYLASLWQVAAKPLLDQATVNDFGADPKTLQFLCGFEG
jgi:hypothetical protein